MGGGAGGNEALLRATVALRRVLRRRCAEAVGTMVPSINANKANRTVKRRAKLLLLVIFFGLLLNRRAASRTLTSRGRRL
jgi:hypothetical protein